LGARPETREGAYEAAVKLGEEARAASNRVDASRLAELASGYAVLALLSDGARRGLIEAVPSAIATVGSSRPIGSVLSTVADVRRAGDRPKALECSSGP
jgi:hypothetical protein